MFTLFLIGLVLPMTATLLFFWQTRGLPKWTRLIYGATVILEMPAVFLRFIFGGLFGFLLVIPMAVIVGGILTLILSVLGIPTRIPAALPPQNAFPGAVIPSLRTLTVIGGIGATIAAFFLGFVLVTALSVSIGPLIWSLLHLIFPGLPGGGWYTRWSLGARIPSQREKLNYERALAAVRARTRKNFTVPSHMFVMEGMKEQAFVIGTVIYISKMALHPMPGSDDPSRHLEALLAHTLGYVNSANGRLILALRRLVVPPMYLLSYFAGETAPGNFMIRFAAGMAGASGAVTVWIISFVLSLAGGGVGELLLSPFWGGLFGRAIYSCDDWAAEAGYAQELIDYLEFHDGLFDIAVPYLLRPRVFAELRIDRLRAYLAKSPRRTTQSLTLQPQN